MRFPARVNFKTAVRWLLGLLFIWAAVSKLANPTEFLGSILAYDLPLPGVLPKLAAVVLPWLELLCGLSLLANFWPESSLGVMFVLFLIFIAATGQAWARGLDISCGCFDLSILGISGDGKTMEFIESATFAFFRNIVLANLIGYLFISRIMTQAPAEGPA